ncbi:MAG: hypothetical protein HC781_17525 [Leptolyngbyaceae cyanobacterium CSU_1_4]|nr:hypothetical protein [Leptolyngbyaceae cyanobacterium CSU_1_4]
MPLDFPPSDLRSLDWRSIGSYLLLNICGSSGILVKPVGQARCLPYGKLVFPDHLEVRRALFASKHDEWRAG